MGRRRKKRKYTRRKTMNGPTQIVAFEIVNEARMLSAKVKSIIASADPLVARVAVMELIGDLQWAARLIEPSEVAVAP